MPHYFASANRNKLSVALDLKTAEGRSIARKLALDADVLLGNYRVEALPRAGLDYASLSAINPRLIYCLISGFGANPSDYDVDVRDTKTGAGVRVRGDDRLVRLYTWSIRTVMAVEPFVGIDLVPGATKRWAYTYTYTAAAKAP